MEPVKIPMEELYELILLQLSNGGKATLIVTGVSMKPMLTEHRDSVLLIPVTKDPVVGDVVLYRRGNGQFVLHRIIRLTPECYLISGDNQCVLEKVTREQMLAVVDGFARKGKQYSVRAPLYRVYVWACTKLFCLRRTYIKVRRRTGKVWRKLTNRRK